MHEKIINAFNTWELLSYQQIYNRLGINPFSSIASNRMYKAMQDLLAEGRLERVAGDLYKLNQ